MNRLPLRLLLACFAFTTVLASAPALVHATEVWSGYSVYFVKPDHADWNLPANQDRILPGTWLTRKDTQGLFNIAQEALYGGVTSTSPLNTEWAIGHAVDHATLTFQPWTLYVAQAPPFMIGVDSVLHLIAEDIYIDIRLDSWSSGALSGGGFSYHRGQPGVVPVGARTWGAIKSLYR